MTIKTKLHDLFVYGVALISAFSLAGVNSSTWLFADSTQSTLKNPSALISNRAAAGPSKTGYIHMHPSGKGFVYDGGAKFIPNSSDNFRLTRRYFNDDPATGREYVASLGAGGFSRGDCNTPDTPGYTYEEYFAELERNGMTGMRVWLDGGDGSSIDGNGHLGLEPIPVGRYYVFDECVIGNVAQARDPNHPLYKVQIDGLDLLTNYPDCHYPNFTDDNCGATYGPKLRKSLLTRMLQAADRHNVKVRLVLFGAETDDWPNAAYNSANGGPIATAAEFFTDPQALEYQKRRVQFVISTWGDSSAIWNWEIYNELNFAAGSIESHLAWADTIAQYIKQTDTHRRPVAVSSWVDPTWVEGAGLNPIFEHAAIDFVDFHTYDEPVLAQRRTYARMVEQMYNKPYFIGEYWPFTAQNGPSRHTVGDLLVEPELASTPPYENIPYRPSLLHNWVQLVGSGTSVAQRWMGRGLHDLKGYPDGKLDAYTLAPLYGPTAKFINLVNWDNWDLSRSRPWESNVASPQADFIIARGDDDQVMILVHGTQETAYLSVGSLMTGTYDIKYLDFITGNLVESTVGDVTGSTLSLAVKLDNHYLDTRHDGYDRKRFGLVLAEKQGGTPAPWSTIAPFPSPTLSPAELIIDDADPGFTTTFAQDAWIKYTQVGGMHYGDTHYYNHQVGTGQDRATWSFVVPQPGNYEVYAWWWEGNWRPADVLYTVNAANGAYTVKMSQKINGGKWNLLGTYPFQSQGSVVVSDAASNGYDIVADAVRLVFSPSLLPTPTNTPTPTRTRRPMNTPIPTSTPTPTKTRTPTNTPTPTSTPTDAPTATYTPTQTTTPLGQDIYEPNDSPDAATLVNVGKRVNATLHAGDVDWWKVYLKANHTYRIQVNAWLGNLTAGLYSSSLALVAQNDDCAPGDRLPCITFTTPDEGFYYVTVMKATRLFVGYTLHIGEQVSTPRATPTSTQTPTPASQ